MYIIKKGECIMQSNRNPLSVLDTRNCKVDTSLKTKRGFLSRSINTFQIGLLESNQWAGEERVFKKDEQPFDYSIVARTSVEAYEIYKQDARKKLTTELMNYLARIMEQRYNWIELRTKYLIEKTRDVAGMDPSKEKYDDNLAVFHKRYPAASAYAVTNIRKKHLLSKAQSVKPLPVLKTAANLSSIPVPTSQRNLSTTTQCVPESPAIRGETRSSLLTLRHLHTPSVMENDCSTSRMDIATATPKLFENKKLVPMFTKMPERSRVSALSSTRMLSSPTVNVLAREVPMAAAMSQFSVGCRTIMLLSQFYRNRPISPNQNYLKTPKK